MNNHDAFRVPRPQWRPPATGYAPYRSTTRVRRAGVVVPGDALLLEDGNDLLLESDDRILMES